MKVVCSNKRAYHDYFIEEAFESGIALLGTEVKSLREGKASLGESHVIIKGSGVFLLNCHISPYSHGNIANHEPLRTKKLLLKKAEINKLRGKIAERGFTLVPLKIYFKGPLAKVEIGLARGKKLFEKREAIKEKEAKREIHRALKTSNRGQ
ncbi:MAG: SsrA-binding protein SmpB [Thermodesulfovibrionales bacterium]|nr:SsrA-binding protein SmpB [Thermodesulfovibrionales bacterium]